MKTNSTSRKYLFLPLLIYWLSAGISALLIAWVLNWLIRLIVPSVMDDFVHPILWRMQIELTIIIILIIIVTLLLDRACFLAFNMHNPNNAERRIEDETKAVGNNLLDYVLLLDSKKDRFIMQSILTIGLALHLLLVGYLAFYGYQQFLMSLDLLVGGPGLIIVIAPILLAANTLFAFCILINTYSWSPIWVNHLWRRFSFVMASLIITVSRLILIMMTIWLFNFTIIKGNGLIIGSRIIFTIILGLLAGACILSIFARNELYKAEKM